MVMGIPKEIKKGEFRVAVTPAGVKVLCEAEHKVFVKRKAGEESGFFDEEFQKAGAEGSLGRSQATPLSSLEKVNTMWPILSIRENSTFSFYKLAGRLLIFLPPVILLPWGFLRR